MDHNDGSILAPAEDMPVALVDGAGPMPVSVPPPRQPLKVPASSLPQTQAPIPKATSGPSKWADEEVELLIGHDVQWQALAPASISSPLHCLPAV